MLCVATVRVPQQTTAATSHRIPSLDGWRGIAILAVIVDHTAYALRGQNAPAFFESLGKHGVTIFFVLSGYLITNRLMHEEDRNGAISLRAFYIRRFFRLMPAAWAYLAFLAIARGHHIRDLDIPACLLFYRNFSGVGVFTGHFWSLSIEEQFYLVWPGVFLMAGRRKAKWIALAAAAGIASFRLVSCGFAMHLQRPQEISWTQYRADALFIGCAAAMLAPKLIPHMRRWMTAPTIAVIVLGTLTDYTLVPLYESIAIALALMLTSAFSHSLTGRLLTWKPLSLLGIISYSVYLWQEPIFAAHTVERLAVFISLILCMASASYYFIERPCIRLGHRISHQSKPQVDVPTARMA